MSMGTTTAMPECSQVPDQTYSASGGGELPYGGEPPDDDGSDGPSHLPSPNVPIPRLPHHDRRGNPPPGPPDGGDGGGGGDSDGTSLGTTHIIMVHPHQRLFHI